MAVQGKARSDGDDAARDLFESKLHPPPPRTATVSRAALLDRLDASSHVPISCVVAPPGYGKTTLLSEWAQRAPRPVAWVSLDRHDNNLGVLMTYTAAALDRVEPVDPELMRPLATRRSVASAVSRVAGAISAMKEPVVLVYDHMEALENDECLDAIAELALHLPSGSRLALATRAKVPLPMPRLRASGEVVEVGVEDLAMTNAEARMLLRNAGVELADTDLEKVVERTEGWPVGLYLAALALKAGSPHEAAGLPFSGDDRLMADYLRSEILSSLSDEEVAFLTHTSVLDRMNGPLCDAVLQSRHSEQILESLARSNLLLIPLDRQGTWYRYHHLFRDLLRAELHRHEAERVTELHLRAATWYEANGLPELALDQAQAGNDPERVNRLLLENATIAYGAGRGESVRRWLQWFETQGHIEQYPAVAILGALFFSNAGEAAEAERWTTAAQSRSVAAPPVVEKRASPQRILPEGSTLESWQAILRLIVGRDGADAAHRDAEIALNGLSPDSGYRAVAMLLDALAYLIEGNPDPADPLLARAADSALRARRLPAALIAIAERGFIAIERDDWASADELSHQVLAIVEATALDDYSESGLVFILAARVALHRGDAGAAQNFATRAARIRPLLTYSRPAISLRILLELARLYVALADISGARVVLRQARDIVQQRPRMGTLPNEIEELRSRIEALHTGQIGASSLTTAELRLVPLLPTHLTFPQIGERLFISRTTVKTHAISIYQKLGVSSRREAVEQLQEIGLLET